MRDNGDFLKDLRAEINATQERRSAYIHQKFLFVVGLLGVGTISVTGEIETLWVLYLAPLVAFSFDLYIYGEDFGVKRAGAFFRKASTEAPQNEKDWEQFVKKNRDPLSYLAGVFLSMLVLLGAAVGLWAQGRESGLYWVWIAVNLAAIVGLRLYRQRLARLEKEILRDQMQRI